MALSSDPRAGLQDDPTAQKQPNLPFQVADYVKFYENAPSQKTALHSTWYSRGQNFLAAYTEAKDGAVLDRAAQSDEYMLILLDPHTAATIEMDGALHDVPGYSLTIVPPGPSRITIDKGGVVVRVFSTQSSDLNEICLNQQSYAEPDPNVAPYEPWPAPKDGYRIRTYSLDVPDEPGRFGRIWQSSNLMVNIFAPQGKRDIKKMSPHYHDDFQQGWLVLEGECVHHLRWPWSTDLEAWREDEHIVCGGPSFAVVPPPSMHTTQMTGEKNVLIDIFSPPREDFAARPGWVLNQSEYPLPARKD